MSRKNKRLNSEDSDVEELEEQHEPELVLLPDPINPDTWKTLSVEVNADIIHVTSAMNAAPGRCIVRSTVFQNDVVVGVSIIETNGQVGIVKDADTQQPKNAIMMGG